MKSYVKGLEHKMSTNLTPLESFINHKADTQMQCGNYSIEIEKPKKGEQYRFHFDATACVGCHCCEVACNEQNNNPADTKWRRVGEMQSGTFPNVSHHFNSMSCNHCIDPECLKGCPTQSYIKFDNGIVYHEDETCIGCQYCTWNCPYEVPTFNKDRGIITKCHMCHDKLEVGQTPACVQACPAGAIEIEVVNTQEWLETGIHKEGIAPHLPDVDITKPTTRYTLNETPSEIIPADNHIVKPNHAEWPLVFMTILTQISLGAFAALTLGDIVNMMGFNLIQPTLLMMIAVFTPAAIGLPLSALHLGRPLLAHTAMKNIKSSWLSKEAFALGVFTAGMSLIIVLYFFNASQMLRVFLEVLVLGIGIYGIYAQSMIYRIKARPSWNKKETTQTFFAVSYIGGLIISALLLMHEAYSSAAVSLPLTLLIALYQTNLVHLQKKFYAKLEKSHSHFYQLNKTKQLYEKQFKQLNQLRIILICFGALILPLLALLFLASSNYKTALLITLLATVISFVSEIIARSLFYKTAVAQGLAGNFFLGNQR